MAEGPEHQADADDDASATHARLRRERLVNVLNRILAEAGEAIDRAEFSYAELGAIGDGRAVRVTEALHHALGMRPGSLRHVHSAARDALRVLVDG